MNFLAIPFLVSIFFTAPSGILRVYGTCSSEAKITTMAMNYSIELAKLGIYKKTGFVCNDTVIWYTKNVR